VNCSRRIIVTLLALAALVLCLAAAAPAQQEEAVYRRVKDDYAWLLKHPKAAAIYQNWQTLAERFSRIYTANPQGPLAPASLYWMARIHHQAYLRFKRKQDLHDAVDLCRRLIRHFPRSRLADDAQYRIGALYERAGDLQQAYLEYLKVTTNYPRGDMAPKARAKLDALERRLAGRVGPAAAGGVKTRPARAAAADPTLAEVTALRHWSTPTYTRVVLDLERPVPYKTRLLGRNRRAHRPRRLVLDLRGARLGPALKQPLPLDGGLLLQARAAQYNPDTVRVVLEIKALSSYKVFTLDNPFRVVIDCFGPRRGKPAKTRSVHRRKVPRGRAHEKPPQVGLAAALGLTVKRVVLDPGHGGKDPGAIWRGLREKDLVLDIARRTAKKLRKLLHCQVLLTRNRDVFLPLEDRTAFANTHDADLFVSIHINASPSHRLNGVETYFLNLASDEESLRVAARENATTQRSISDLQVILNDLMLNSKINESNRLARSVQRNLVKTLRRTYKVRNLKVKQAPFYVLIGARMPAILVETGFITNPTEHRRLASPRYRQQLAEGIARGIADYVKKLKSAGAG